MIRRPPRSTPFPSPTLFRSLHRLAREQSALFAGRPVRVTSPQGRFAAGAALLDGRVVDEISAYGKHLFARFDGERSEEHTSELQSRQYLVCRLLLEKKKNRP